VRKLEDEVWREILAVAEGKKTAFSAMMGLKAHFVSTNAPAHLTTADLEFFSGGTLLTSFYVPYIE
jgi:hypothetical protein